MKKFVLSSALLFCSIYSLLLAQSSRPMVSDISTTAKNTSEIIIKWTLPSTPISSLNIYRDLSPISSRTHLSTMTPVASVKGTETSYIDSISDYREYYYAVIAVSDGSIYDVALPSVNASVTGVRVMNQISTVLDSSEETTNKTSFNVPTEKPLTEGSIRELPLPYLNVLPGQGEQGGKISDVGIDAAMSLATVNGGKKKLSPYLFRQEQNEEQSGDEYLLYSIINEYFNKKQYDTAADSLQGFLQIKRKDDVTNRATFYLGQSLYYLGLQREALNVFISLPDSYEILSKRWIQAVLEAM